MSSDGRDRRGNGSEGDCGSGRVNGVGGWKARECGRGLDAGR